MYKLIAASLLLSASSLFGQAADAAAAPANPFVHGNFKWSALADAYWSKNFNNPGSESNLLIRNFDVNANSVNLSFLRGTLDYAPGPVGFHVTMGYGRGVEILHGAEQAGKAFQYLPQFYLSFKPSNWKGVQVDVGKFYTSAGAELTDTHLNWFYSRPYLYANGPYYHFGARVSGAVNSKWTTGVQIVNGWNNIWDNNSGKTIGLTNTVTLGKVALYNNFYTGPENASTNRGWRNFNDTVAVINWHKRATSYINYDHGWHRSIDNQVNQFSGLALAHKFALTDKMAIAGRWEYYRDRDGFITGTAQTLREVTATGEYKLHKYLLGRMEWRRDSSGSQFFQRGTDQTRRHQNTFLIGMVLVFGPEM
jgi:hypothetical protein